MATFNPQTNDTSGNFLGYSRGTGPNRAFEALFEGLGSSFSGTVKTADTHIQNRIKDDVYAAYDEANDAFGVNDGAVAGQAAMGRPQEQPLPNELTQATNRLQRMGRARDAGTLKESHFWGMLETDVKRLRQKYPGYREQIDSIVSSITGSTPANALRNSLLNEWDAAAREARAGDLNVENYVKDNEKYIDPVFFERFISGDRSPELIAEIRRDVSGKKRDEHALEVAHQEMTSLKLSGELDTQDVVKQARSEVNDFINQKLFSLANGAGTDFMKRAKEYGEGGLDEKEAAELLSMFQELKFQWGNEVENILTRPWTDGSGNSYSSELDDKAREDVRKVFQDRMTLLEGYITNDQVGLLALTANVNKLTKDSTVRQLLDSNEMFKILQAIPEIGGTEAFNAMLLNNPELKTDLMEAVNAFIVGKTVTGETNSAAEAADDMRNMRADPETHKQTIQNWIDIVTNKDNKWPDAAVVNTAKALFGVENNGFLTKYTENSRMPIFSNLVSPQVTARILEASKTNPELFTNYERWARDNFYVLFEEKAAELKQTFMNPGFNSQVTYDAATNEFVPVFKPDPSMPIHIQTAHEEKLKGELEDLNVYSKLLDPIVTAKGGDTGAEMAKLLESIGIGFLIEKETKEDRDNVSGKKKTSAKTQGMEGIQAASYIPEDDQALADMIGAAEGADYDTFSGGSNQALTSMTVGQVRELQRNWESVPNAISSAAGKPQIIADTMDWLIQTGVLDPEEAFDAEAQDRAILALMNRRGYQRFKAGKLSKEKFLDNLAAEWASIPNSSGLSAYHDDGVNRATKGGEAIASLLLR